MRIISGKYKNREIAAPQGKTTRPVLSRVRKAIFDTAGDLLDGARVLDLFAGSGAMGIEALSRGAASATFVESDAYSAKKTGIWKSSGKHPPSWASGEGPTRVTSRRPAGGVGSAPATVPCSTGARSASARPMATWRPPGSPSN